MLRIGRGTLFGYEFAWNKLLKVPFKLNWSSEWENFNEVKVNMR